MNRQKLLARAMAVWVSALAILPGFRAATVAQGTRSGAESNRSEDSLPPLPRVHRLEGESEAVWASDMLLTESRIRYGQQADGTEWEAAVAYATFDEDYRPFNPIDFFGFPEQIHEDRYGVQLELRQRVAPRWTLLGSASGYVGYLNYRRVWIANRYRQKYDHPDFPRIPGYEEPDPKGYGFSGGTRWEYLPNAGFAELKLGYAHDQIARGYSDGLDSSGQFMLIRGRERFDTASISFSSENVLLKRARLLNEFTAATVTEREWRFTYQGSLNLAVGERCVLRGYGGISTEEPQFDAHFFGLTVECEVIPSVHVSLTGRYYEDTGEIESSLPVTTAAPPLSSWEIGLGLRFAWGRSSLKVYAGPFWTDYHPEPGVAEEFTFLYADRKWGLAQIAYSVQF